MVVNVCWRGRAYVIAALGHLPTERVEYRVLQPVTLPYLWKVMFEQIFSRF